MKIKIPGRGPITIYSDTDTFVDLPGDVPIEVVEAPGGGPVIPDQVWVSTVGGTDYWVSTVGGTDYWVSTSS